MWVHEAQLCQEVGGVLSGWPTSGVTAGPCCPWHLGFPSISSTGVERSVFMAGGTEGVWPPPLLVCNPLSWTYRVKQQLFAHPDVIVIGGEGVKDGGP